ncbi:MAG: TIGR00341 family protein, partial [Gammaproteobacteria bacterium]|nr:TIGR00341 family protein [Gammaproteobacteria bacterium]MCW8928177.1 TIGR00341 family protein [Gammaproteobacteria bacterium]
MRMLEVIANVGHRDAVIRLAREHDALDIWTGHADEQERQAVRILIAANRYPELLDALEARLHASKDARIVVFPVDATLPRIEEKPSEEKEKSSVTASREELYNDVSQGARLDGNYLLLVALSTIVAAIGLLENNVAVVIGAMVIAPLLGPNMALALGTALGDTALMWQALRTNLTGILVAFAVALLIGLLRPMQQLSEELLSRTDIGLDGIALALASGAAAVLSLTTRVSSVLVGVMVAVALLPPTTAIGLMLGSGRPDLAGGAALLLATNIVCVNLSAKLVFLYKSVKPRTWLEQQKARQSMSAYIVLWLVSLAIL